jgi:protease secretion system membrane fusion protein
MLKLLKPAPESQAPLPATVLPATDDSETDPRRPARLGLWVIAIGFGGFLLWAAFAPLDEGVPSQGAVAVSTKRKPVQHPSGGVVKAVLVGEGDHVKDGQVLVKLDEAATRANYETVRQHYMMMLATQSRLIAEQTGARTIAYPPELQQAAAADPIIRAQLQNHDQLFQSRRSALTADVQGLNEAMQGQQAMITSYQGVLASRRTQLQLLNDELTQTRELVKEGYAPRNRQLELERMLSDIHGSVAEIMGNTSRAQRAIAELRQKVIGRQQEYRKEVDSMLADVNRETQSDEAKFKALSEDLQRVEIRSPASGQVVGLSVQTVGAVIQAGQKLMDIVPDNEALVIESRVAPNQIDRVRAGLPVDVRFGAFANTPQLVVGGKVQSISADLVADQQANGQSGSTFYLARVVLTPEGQKRLGQHVLQPGMPVEVVFRTGERTLLAYLLHPLSKRLAASLKEE